MITQKRTRWAALWSAFALAFVSIFGLASPASAGTTTTIYGGAFYSTDGGAQASGIKATWYDRSSGRITFTLSDKRADGRDPRVTVTFRHSNGTTVVNRHCTSSSCTYTLSSGYSGQASITLKVCNGSYSTYCSSRTYHNNYSTPKV